jgi:hypothetical protein
MVPFLSVDSALVVVEAGGPQQRPARLEVEKQRTAQVPQHNPIAEAF